MKTKLLEAAGRPARSTTPTRESENERILKEIQKKTKLFEAAGRPAGSNPPTRESENVQILKEI